MGHRGKRGHECLTKDRRTNGLEVSVRSRSCGSVRTRGSKNGVTRRGQANPTGGIWLDSSPAVGLSLCSFSFFKFCLLGCVGSYLRHAGSFAALRQLSYSRVCGILVLLSGIEPTSPAWQGRFLTTGPPGKSLSLSSMK